jgi:hypothetical protein
LLKVIMIIVASSRVLRDDFQALDLSSLLQTI